MWPLCHLGVSPLVFGCFWGSTSSGSAGLPCVFSNEGRPHVEAVALFSSDGDSHTARNNMIGRSEHLESTPWSHNPPPRRMPSI